jgi:hypothetical protein
MNRIAQQYDESMSDEESNHQPEDLNIDQTIDLRTCPNEFFQKAKHPHQAIRGGQVHDPIDWEPLIRVCREMILKLANLTRSRVKELYPS